MFSLTRAPGCAIEAGNVFSYAVGGQARPSPFLYQDYHMLLP